MKDRPRKFVTLEELPEPLRRSWAFVNGAASARFRRGYWTGQWHKEAGTRGPLRWYAIDGRGDVWLEGFGQWQRGAHYLRIDDVEPEEIE